MRKWRSCSRSNERRRLNKSTSAASQMINPTSAKQLAAIFVLLLTGTVATNAELPQITQPTDRDLHASYCSVVIEKLDIPFFEKALASRRPPNGTASSSASDALVVAR